jgi:hypothetical protein
MLDPKEGLAPEASRFRQKMINDHKEQIEHVYEKATKKWGEPPVMLAMDPDDSFAQRLCDAHRETITPESIAHVRRVAEQRGEHPTLVMTATLDVALKMIGPQGQDTLRRSIGKAICCISIAREGKTIMTLPLPPKGLDPEET